MSFQRRDILTDKDDSMRIRILLKQPDITWLFDLDDATAFPYARKTADLLSGMKNGDLRIEEMGEIQTISEKAAARAKLRYQKFEPALYVDSLLTPRKRGQTFFNLRIVHCRLTRKVFDKAVRDWLAGGMTQMSMAPDWENCGRWNTDLNNLELIDFKEAKVHTQELALNIKATSEPDSDSSWTSNASGHPRKRAKPITIAKFKVDRNVLRVFMHYYDWKHIERGRSLTSARLEMVNEIFSPQLADGSRAKLPEHQLPTQRQFNYWYYRIVDRKVRRVANVGDKGYQTEERELLGNEISSTHFVGSNASGDATIWNISIVSRLAGRRAIGCPVVYRIRCKRSGLLLGIAVSLDSAGWIGMAAAIANCVEDKVKFCKKYGIDIESWEWPVRGLPGTFEMDRGETDNHGPDKLMEMTAIRIINLMGQRPDLKGGTESDWRTLEVRLNGITPATLIETWENTQNKNWKLKGQLDIDQFIQILLTHELDRMKQMREGVLLDDKMIAAGTNTSPLSIWDYSLHYEGGGLSSFDLQQVQFALLPRDTGSITERGVLFKGCYYVAAELLERDAFAAARKHGRTGVDIAYDPRLVDFIYIERIGNKTLDQPMVCRLSTSLDNQLAFHGKCFAEVRELNDQTRRNEHAGEELAAKSASETRRTHNAIVKEAKDQTTAQQHDNSSTSEKVRKIPVDRAAERFVHSPSQAFQPFSVPHKAPPSADGESPAVSTVTPLTAVAPQPKQLTKDEKSALEYEASLRRRKQLSSQAKEKQ